MRTIIAILYSILFLVNLHGNNKPFVFERVSPESGFVFDAIHTISQDNNGFVWFGTISGLYFYNSVEVKKIDFQFSNSDISSIIDIYRIYKDRSGQMWVCTDLGLFIFSSELNKCVEVKFLDYTFDANIAVEDIIQLDDYNFVLKINRKLYAFSTKDNSLKDLESLIGFNKTNITYLGKGHDDNVLVGTGDGELFESNNILSHLNLLYHSKFSHITTVCYESGKYYIGYRENGVEVINLDGDKINEFKEDSKFEVNLPSNRVREIIKRNNGEIWMGTYKGIYIVSPEGERIVRSSVSNGLPHNSIYVLYKDVHEGIWIGTWSGGLAYYSDYNYRFQHYKRIKISNMESQTVISSFAESYDNGLLIGSDHAGLFYADQMGKIKKNIPLRNGSNFITKVKTLTTEDGKDIWIGTFGDGVWKYNLISKTIVKLKADLFNNVIISSLAIADNKLWIGTRGISLGLVSYDLESKTFEKVEFMDSRTKNLWYRAIWKVYVDTKKNLWICTDNGVFTKKAGSNEFVQCFSDQQEGELNKTSFYTVCEDNNGVIWLGSRGKGLFVYDEGKDSVSHFSDNELLANADIYSITLDGNNDLWYATNKGLFRYDKKNRKTKFFTTTDGLTGNLYNPNASCLSSSGNLFFGNPNGYSVINPSTIEENPNVPNVFLSKLLVNNVPYYSDSTVKVDAKHVADIRNITLAHSQNSVTFSFVSNNYVKSSKNRFKYRLINYQDNWAETYMSKEVTFTKVPSGDYVLEVYGSNNDNVWSVDPLLVNINIKSSLWFSWYAYLAYILVLVSLSFVVVRELMFRIKTRKQIMEERYENEANEALHSEKLRFFTNVSHEFRTPLTLIISPLNNLLARFKYDNEIVSQIKIVIRNAERLLRLTNQILDFRLMEVGKIKVNKAKTEIVDVCRNTANCFEIQMKEKQVNFVFKSQFKTFFITVDAEKIENIVYNLIGNAIKFSTEKEQIIFSLEKAVLKDEDYDNITFTGNKFIGESLVLKVQDYGSGIAPQLLPNIFDRFSRSADPKNGGTGIGLHICQEYAKLNDANIMVHSRINEGTTFSLNIPVTQKLEYTKGNIIIQPQFDTEPTDFIEEEAEVVQGASGGSNEIVLLVEDNDDLRLYLKGILSAKYKVLTAKNGRQGLEIANEIVPDIIITDILMPGLDGIELTKGIKSNKKTKHIQIIVLTALSERSYQKRSIIEGADAFLTKPIDPATLIAQIENILSSREMYKDKLIHDDPEKAISKSISKQPFMQEVESIIEKNMQNPQFDITQLSKELNLSKSTVHRRIKRNTNQSTSEFMRDVRLKHAVKLLKNSNYNMDEIGFFVGFNSTSYFIRSFKKKYGKTPKEFGRNM